MELQHSSCFEKPREAGNVVLHFRIWACHLSTSSASRHEMTLNARNTDRHRLSRFSSTNKCQNTHHGCTLWRVNILEQFVFASQANDWTGKLQTEL